MHCDALLTVNAPCTYITGTPVRLVERIDAYAAVRCIDELVATDVQTNMRRPGTIAVEEDEIAWYQIGLGDGRSFLVLIVTAAGQRDSEVAVTKLDEPGAIKTRRRFSAPLVRRADKLLRVLNNLHAKRA